MRRPPTSVGDHYGRLRVIASAIPDRHNRTVWRCRCECGAVKDIPANQLRTGKTTSCGCLRLERNPDALARRPEYAIFRGIISRCENPNVEHFRNYGARGIKVSPLWRNDFRAFLDHIGPRPSPAHSVDRIDVNGDYVPGNVRWARALVQANNRRNTRFVVYRGERMALCDAVRVAGSVIHHEAAWIRIKWGWDTSEALETPRLHESGNSKARRAA